jgi:hypothetical protein
VWANTLVDNIFAYETNGVFPFLLLRSFYFLLSFAFLPFSYVPSFLLRSLALLSSSFYKRNKHTDLFILRYHTGFGGRYVMDDANVPSLLSLPYLGFLDKHHPAYVATRKVLLSRGNPYWAKGANFSGAGWVSRSFTLVLPLPGISFFLAFVHEFDSFDFVIYPSRLFLLPFPGTFWFPSFLPFPPDTPLVLPPFPFPIPSC